MNCGRSARIISAMQSSAPEDRVVMSREALGSKCSGVVGPRRLGKSASAKHNLRGRRATQNGMHS
jgi:hypothetical protein